MDQFTPGYVGNISLAYAATGRAAHLTLKLVLLAAAETTVYGPSGTGIEETEAGVYDIEQFTYPTVQGRYRSYWYDDGVFIPGAFDEFEITRTPLSALLGGGRATMADLLVRVRRLINDPSGASQVFSDAELQQWLDENRRDVRYLELTPEWQTTGSQTQWLNYYDSVYGGCWETDAAFVNGSWVAKTPDTADWLTGKWSFNTSQTPPLFISGRTYDVYSAAADALESWAASVALDFDVSTGRSNLTASRSQKQAMLLKVADQYRARGRSSSVSVERGDT